MGAPCINDTCSIKSSIDPVTRRLNHDVVLNPSGGLSCDNGLKVEILGDPAAAAALDACFQSLGVTPAGELYAVSKRAKFESFGSTDAAPIPHNGNDSASPVNESAIVNPHDCPALVLVNWRMRLGYTVTDPGTDNATLVTPNGIPWIPFGGQLEARLLIDGDAKATAYFDPSGVHPRTASPHNKRDWREGCWAGIIGAGATWNVTAIASYAVGAGNTVQRFNIDTETVAAAFPDRGLKANGQAIILPLGGE
jgi:hypothetical protein